MGRNSHRRGVRPARKPVKRYFPEKSGRPDVPRETSRAFARIRPHLPLPKRVRGGIYSECGRSAPRREKTTRIRGRQKMLKWTGNSCEFACIGLEFVCFCRNSQKFIRGSRETGERLQAPDEASPGSRAPPKSPQRGRRTSRVNRHGGTNPDNAGMTDSGTAGRVYAGDAPAGKVRAISASALHCRL